MDTILFVVMGIIAGVSGLALYINKLRDAYRRSALEEIYRQSKEATLELNKELLRVTQEIENAKLDYKAKRDAVTSKLSPKQSKRVSGSLTGGRQGNRNARRKNKST